MTRPLSPLVFLEVITSDQLKNQFLSLFPQLGLEDTSMSGLDENSSNLRFGFTTDVSHLVGKILMRKKTIYFGYFPKKPPTDPKRASTMIWLHAYLILDDGSVGKEWIEAIRKVQKECDGAPLGVPPLLHYHLKELDKDTLARIIEEVHQAVLVA